MNLPTPGRIAPEHVRRKDLVTAVMQDLDDLNKLPLEQQAVKLAWAQRMLAGVLTNDPNIVQLGLPGVE